MDIVRRDATDPAVIRACHEVATAADAADDPFGPPLTLRRLHGWLAHPVEPTELWVGRRRDGGGIAGWCLLRLPDRENLDRGLLDLFVHPASRRGGVGGALLRHAAERAAVHGRSALAAEALQGSAGAAFAAAVGATPGLVEARRVLALGEIPAGRIAVLREQAARAAAGYSLVSWQGRTPDQYLAGFAEVLNAANDMPRDVGEEEEVWDAERVREQDRWPAGAARQARVHDRGAARRERRDGGADRRRGRPGVTDVGVSAPHRGNPPAPRVTGSACWSRPRCSSGWRWPSRGLSAS